MNFIKGKKIYVFFDPHTSSSFVEVLTIKEQEKQLLFFEEKTPYYAVGCNNFLFYAYSYNVAGNVLIVEELWHLPVAKLIEKCRHFAAFFRKSASAHQYNQAFKKDSSPVF